MPDEVIAASVTNGGGAFRTAAVQSSAVRWVERSETHHFVKVVDGFRFAQPILRAFGVCLAV
jgi:hypothetical protein